MEEKVVVLYGTCWCGDCLRVRRFFDQHQIRYKWVNIDGDGSGEEFVLSTNNGMRSVPTIIFEDGSILVEPTLSELQHKLSAVAKSN